MKIILCHRCALEMLDDGEWYSCPCCKTRTRGPERQEARYQAERQRLGMSEAEYRAHCRSFLRLEPPSEEELTQIRAWAAKQAAEWKPVCEHETSNPWQT